jgi:hypothetical protein
MMTSNTELLKIAQKHLGQGGAVFRKYCGLPSGAAWCNAFVDYVANEGGVKSLYFNGAKETYCPHSIAWCRKNLAQVPLYIAMPMDIIYFDWDRNNVPNHIGFVRATKDTSSIYTIEGNTDGGKVAQKTRPSKYVCGIFRPHFPHTFNNKKLTVDGVMGYQTIGGLQKALKTLKYYTGAIDCVLGLGTVKALQKWAGVSQDGQWGTGTSKAVQKKIGTSADGAFGVNSVKALQKWINANAFPTVSGGTASASKPSATTSNAQKLVNKMKELAWANGTAKKKYAYSTGAPKDACKKAMKKHGYNTKVKWSDCGNFVNTVVRESGIDKNFVVQRAVKAAFPSAGSHFTIVHKGKAIPDGLLKAGDIIRYKKKSGQHAMFYLGGGLICDAGLKNRFANIRKNDHRYNGSNVKKSTIQVLRPKG